MDSKVTLLDQTFLLINRGYSRTGHGQDTDKQPPSDTKDLRAFI